MISEEISRIQPQMSSYSSLYYATPTDYETCYTSKDSECGHSKYSKTQARLLQNLRTKNRWVSGFSNGVFPYDGTIVEITDGYINANYVNTSDNSLNYISTQAPMDNEPPRNSDAGQGRTIEDFWQMVWEHETKLIVMVTKLKEGSTHKSAKYWPDVGVTSTFSTPLGSISVEGVSEPQTSPYVIRKFRIALNSVVREVTQFHDNTWMDSSCANSNTFLQMLMDMHEFRENNDMYVDHSPVVVHCSAGIGRTGTTILADTAIQNWRQGNRDFTFAEELRNMRKQRMYLVSNSGQFRCAMDTYVRFLNK